MEVYRIELREISNPELEALSRGSSSDCATTIRDKAIRTSKLKLHAGDAEKLLTRLDKIDLQSDTCPREKKTGDCAQFNDGGVFDIRVGARQHILIEDISGNEDVTSENQALLDWALRVARATDTPVRRHTK